MRTIHAWMLITLMFCGMSVAKESVNAVPDKVKPVVDDVEQLPVPDQVHLTGMLGGRIDANELKRLLQVNEEELLAGFRQRPGNHPWIGEHIGKWMHASTLAWVYTGDARLREKLDRVAAELIKTQQADGYLGTYSEKDRWTSWDVWVHKYDLLGLLTYYKYTGNEAALDCCRKVGDLLCNTFDKDKRDIIKAGEHMGMAATSVLEPMVLLYRATGEKKYLDFCDYILWAWDQPHGPKVMSSLIAGKGVNETANAKAYEMLSNLVGLCELYRTTGRKDLLTAPLNAWKDIVAKRLYISGSASDHERFVADYELPNTQDHRLMETCVTVTWMQLNIQLLRLTGDAKFADQLERSVYNHLLTAQLPTGDKWCYYTPLQGKKPYGNQTNCCLSSGPRGVALIPTFACGVVGEGIAVNLYEPGTTTLKLADGTKVKIEQETRYPEGTESLIRIRLDKPQYFSLMLRNPEWAQGKMTVSKKVHVADTGNQTEKGYYLKGANWNDGDEVTVKFEMPLRVIEGEHTNAGKLALMRGPLVLAASDGTNAALVGIKDISLPASLESLDFKPVPAPASVVRMREDWQWQVTPCKPANTDKWPLRLTLTALADAGIDGSFYQVWFKKGCDTSK